MKVQILVDNNDSWYLPFAKILKEKLAKKVDSISLVNVHSEVEEGDVLCLVSCEKMFKNLDLNKSNIVVHESSLPKGKGWSPLTWQVLEGAKRIPVTLFEAHENVDSGQIYLQEFIELNGTELLEELKNKQGELTNKMIEEYVCFFPTLLGRKQEGKSSFYSRRTPKDSKIDINKSIDEQFDLLRIVDNEKYPAFFIKNNVKYILKIFKENE